MATTAGVFTYLLRYVSPRDVLELVTAADRRWLCVFFLASLSMTAFRTWRYLVLLAAEGWRPPPGALFLVTLARNFFSDLLPARLGTLVYVYLVRVRLDVALEAAAGSWLLALVFDLAALAVLIGGVAAASATVSPLRTAAAAVLLLALALTALLAMPAVLRAAAAGTRRLAGTRKTALRAAELFNQTAAGLQRTRRRGLYLQVLGLSLNVRFFKYLALYGLFLALVAPLGYPASDFPLPVALLGIVSAEAAASLPFSGFGAFGAYEGAWFAVFRMLGYPARIAAASGISHHLVTQAYGLLLGVGALILLFLLPGRRTRRERKRPAVAGSGDFRFWLRYALATLLVLAAVGATAVTGNRSGTGQPAAGAAAGEPSGPPAGWVVFERPDGVYRQRVGAGEARLIAPGGRYPRWAPEGGRFAFIRQGRVWMARADGMAPRQLAATGAPRALAWHPAGDRVLYTDTGRVAAVRTTDGTTATVVSGQDFYEVDIGPDGRRLVATVKSRWGYRVRAWDLETGRSRVVARGCSASLAPDAGRVTVNSDDHTRLFLYPWDGEGAAAYIPAPGGGRFDNQFWSNAPQWIVSRGEGANTDVYAHHVGSRRWFRITRVGNCDRPDLFVKKAG